MTLYLYITHTGYLQNKRETENYLLFTKQDRQIQTSPAASPSNILGYEQCKDKNLIL